MDAVEAAQRLEEPELQEVPHASDEGPVKKVHYVVACWSGMRRTNPPQYVQDRTAFVQKHLQSLRALRHSLSRITFVIADNPEEPKEYRAWIRNLPKYIQGAPVDVLERPNVGFSYGGYSDVFSRHRTEPDYYLFVEDDYIFRADDFDKTMVGEMERTPRCGFLSFVIEGGTRDWIMSRARAEAPGGAAVADNVARYCPDRFHYARVCIPMVRAAALEDVWKEHGRLPFSGGTDHTECKFEGQFGISMVIEKAGWEVRDMVPKHRVEAWSPTGQVLSYGPADRPIFLSPVQGLLEKAHA